MSAALGIDKLMANTNNSIYKLAVLTAKRAQEISNGSAKLVEMPLGTKLTVIALQEIYDKKVSYKEGAKPKQA